jgi:hypothetical protein
MKVIDEEINYPDSLVDEDFNYPDFVLTYNFLIYEPVIARL